MRGIHAFRRDHITQIITCKPWSPRLCPYPSLAQKMQAYLELRDPEANHPQSNPNHPDKPNTPSQQKAPAPRRPAYKKTEEEEQEETGQ